MKGTVKFFFHMPVLHACCFFTGPVQWSPPCWGVGLLQNLSLSLYPWQPEGMMQDDHDPHSPKTPSTAVKCMNYLYIKLYIISNISPTYTNTKFYLIFSAFHQTKCQSMSPFRRQNSIIWKKIHWHFLPYT